VSEDFLTRRRRFLQSATAGGAALLAGCTGLNNQDGSDGSDDGTGDDGTGGDDSDDSGDDDGTGGNGGDDGTGGNGGDDGTGGNGDDDGTGGNGDDDGSEDEPPEPGEGERQVGTIATLGFQEQQALRELRVQLQQEEIEEAEFETQVTELLEPVLTDLTDSIESETGGSVVETLPVLGAVRVNGPAEALIDVVQLDSANALVSRGDLDVGEQPAQ
jgi:hypothetical protein